MRLRNPNTRAEAFLAGYLYILSLTDFSNTKDSQLFQLEKTVIVPKQALTNKTKLGERNLATFSEIRDTICARRNCLAEIPDLLFDNLKAENKLTYFIIMNKICKRGPRCENSV
jgi:hypothetical protein